MSGIILKRNFVEGSDVEAGQSLYQIDPATYRAAWNSAKGDEAKAEAAAAIAHLTVKRYVPLLGTKYISQQEYDQAVATARRRCRCHRHQSAVETARINLAYTKVTSPLAGASVNRASPKGRWSPTASRMPWLPSSSSIPSMLT